MTRLGSEPAAGSCSVVFLEAYATCMCIGAIAAPPTLDDHPADGPAVLLIEPVRRAQRRTKTEGKGAARPSTPTIGSKRPAESGDHDRDRAKRPRTDAQAVPMSSPSKGYKEVDGVVIIEDDVDDVIVIDD
ncbi:hypothetical protein BU17DRAFT_87064 [Hysterangium stoloniferum]|nr:hypothetical protein BU17DRAFT_87064 [Hysterangium stoloniferum]